MIVPQCTALQDDADRGRTLSRHFAPTTAAYVDRIAFIVRFLSYYSRYVPFLALFLVPSGSIICILCLPACKMPCLSFLLLACYNSVSEFMPHLER